MTRERVGVTVLVHGRLLWGGVVYRMWHTVCEVFSGRNVQWLHHDRNYISLTIELHNMDCSVTAVWM
jgi:hypothetical protein